MLPYKPSSFKELFQHMYTQIDAIDKATRDRAMRHPVDTKYLKDLNPLRDQIFDFYNGDYNENQLLISFDGAITKAFNALLGNLTQPYKEWLWSTPVNIPTPFGEVVSSLFEMFKKYKAELAPSRVTRSTVQTQPAPPAPTVDLPALQKEVAAMKTSMAAFNSQLAEKDETLEAAKRAVKELEAAKNAAEEKAKELERKNQQLVLYQEDAQKDRETLQAVKQQLVDLARQGGQAQITQPIIVIMHTVGVDPAKEAKPEHEAVYQPLSAKHQCRRPEDINEAKEPEAYDRSLYHSAATDRRFLANEKLWSYVKKTQKPKLSKRPAEYEKEGTDAAPIVNEIRAYLLRETAKDWAAMQADPLNPARLVQLKQFPILHRKLVKIQGFKQYSDEWERVDANAKRDDLKHLDQTRLRRRLVGKHMELLWGRSHYVAQNKAYEEHGKALRVSNGENQSAESLYTLSKK